VHEEAGRHLRLQGPCIVQRRAGVGEILLGHVMVRLDGGRDVGLVDADGNAHEHVLRALDDLSVHLEEVGPF
jgi:hypothetical protein